MYSLSLSYISISRCREKLERNVDIVESGEDLSRNTCNAPNSNLIKVWQCARLRSGELDLRISFDRRSCEFLEELLNFPGHFSYLKKNGC